MALTERYVTSGAGGGGSGTSGSPWTFAEAITHSLSNTGQRYNVQSDAGYSIGTTTFGAGTFQLPNIWRGYDSTIGDCDNLGRNTDGTLNTTGMPVITITGLWTMANYVTLQNFNITGALSSTLIGDVTVDLWNMISCRVENTQNNAAATAVSCDDYHVFTNCDFICSGAASDRVLIGDVHLRFTGCRFEITSTDNCLEVQSTVVLVNCVFLKNGSLGGVGVLIDIAISTIAQPQFVNCTFYNLTDAIKSTQTHTGGSINIIESHATDCTQFVTNTTNIACYAIHNRTRDNTSPPATVELIEVGAITTDTGGASTDFADSGANDLHLITSAPGYNAGWNGGDINLYNIMTDTYAPTGWTPDQDWDYASVAVVSTTKLRITINASAVLAWYWRGEKHTQAVQFLVTSTADKAEGIWYCYSTDGATFILNQTIFYIFDKVSGSIRADLPVFAFYWDNTNNVTLWIQPEFHAATMSPAVHGYAHESFGTRYANGLDITYGVTAANNDTRIKLTSGEIHDEDISAYITHADTPAEIWEQILGSAGTADANYAALPIYYLSGATPVWRKTVTSSYPFLPVSNNYIYYNRLNAGSYDYSTSVGSSSFVVYWIIATTNQAEPIVVIPGRLDNATLTAAQAEAFPSLITLFTEYKLLYRVIYQTSAANSNNGKCKINTVTDYRKDAVSNNAGTTTIASAALVSFTPTVNISATNVQAAIEEVAADVGAIISAKQMLLFGGANGTIAASTTNYFNVNHLGLLTAAGRNASLPAACTISSLYIETTGAQPASGTLVATVLKNNVATAITITIPISGAAGIYTDLIHSVSFSAGDAITVQLVNNATGASAALGPGSLLSVF